MGEEGSHRQWLQADSCYRRGGWAEAGTCSAELWVVPIRCSESAKIVSKCVLWITAPWVNRAYCCSCCCLDCLWMRLRQWDSYMSLVYDGLTRFLAGIQQQDFPEMLKQNSLVLILICPLGTINSDLLWVLKANSYFVTSTSARPLWDRAALPALQLPAASFESTANGALRCLLRNVASAAHSQFAAPDGSVVRVTKSRSRWSTLANNYDSYKYSKTINKLNNTKWILCYTMI